ncbi:MAG TPA: thioredoxin family protein [Hyphomicrobiaceae bacterium]|nr:thioredoxin family protein [Hyphomicrobiaceae bacterium]
MPRKRSISRRATLAGLSGLAAGMATKAHAAPRAELIMFDATWCGYCKKFKREVAPTYSSTRAGGIFPLRIIDIERETPDFSLKEKVRGTPTFVIVADGIEIARFSGYGGPDHFYETMDRIISAWEQARQKWDRGGGDRA